jgi:signal transduction histidine kinase
MIFKTKSRAIELLGRKQIRDGTTALAELLKNSYDADAKSAKAIFNTRKAKPYLILADSGFGMTEDDIVSKWLVIGTNSKTRRSKEVRRTPSGRLLMGEKGIGRLASACLGQQLLLFSKSQKNSKWNMLFIDWSIFENPYSFIEDVDVGTHFNKDFDFFNNMENIIPETINHVCRNIYKESWYLEYEDENGNKQRKVKPDIEELWNKIQGQLNEIYIPYKSIMNQLETIEKHGQGTIMYITNLWEDWDGILNTTGDSKDKERETYAFKNYTRLQTFLYPLNNTREDFKVKLLYNNVPLAIEYGFSEDDYKIYDVRIDGYIEKGKFYGKLSVLNSNIEILNQCNQELEKGIDVANTMPLELRQESDCGRFEIKLCHVEGSKKNTSLEESIWQSQKEKLENYGGVMIFRDGVRILPYGEPENDFLELEKRRLIKAGEYIFSHRRLFGRIDITHQENSLLEDKSSREGFIENKQYYYFITTLKTLLTIIAQKYLNGSGIRNSYIINNNENYEKKLKEDAAVKEQKILFKEEKARLNKALIANRRSLLVFIEYLASENNRYQQKMLEFHKCMDYTTIVTCYNELVNTLFGVEKQILRNIDDYKVVVAEKFRNSLPEDTLYDVSKFNAELDTIMNEKLGIIQSNKNEVNLFYNMKINEWESNIKNFSGNSIDYYKSFLGSTCNDLLNQAISLQKELDYELVNRSSQLHSIIDAINKQIELVYNAESNLRQKTLMIKNSQIEKINSINNMIDELVKLNPIDIKEKVNNTIEVINILSEDIRNTELKLRKEIRVIMDAASPKITAMGEFIQNDYDVTNLVDALTKRNIELEKENEILADLANTGLAAEIVDHEFNQYFTNVTNAIKSFNNTALTSKGKKLLKQIDVGFRAIGNRHSQLSPMYRSYNLKKTDINVYDMVKNTVEFFSMKLENSGIQVKYDIPENSVLSLSPSKIYPVLSNLLDNAVYWVLSGEKRIILWRYNHNDRSLYIEDSGPGIDPRAQNRIFDKFYSEKPYGLGRGLGLSIAKKVLEMEGHTITVILDHTEKYLSGACFKITFGEEK